MALAKTEDTNSSNRRGAVDGLRSRWKLGELADASSVVNYGSSLGPSMRGRVQIGSRPARESTSNKERGISRFFLAGSLIGYFTHVESVQSSSGVDMISLYLP